MEKMNNPNSVTPQINYRFSERIFCRCFNAKNIATKDISIDAYKDNYGFGIKTFQNSNKQKIAEFNDPEKYPLSNSDPINVAKTISNYRNMRLYKVIEDYNLSKIFYHFIYRNNKGEISIHEQNIDLINLDGVFLRKSKKNHIVEFSDGLNDYSFNIKKSTLYMKFNLQNPFDSFEFENKRDDIMYVTENFLDEPLSKSPLESIYLHLYSERRKKVFPKSGLNQWNADGRPRHHDEVYIPIPIKIHNDHPNFFPPRDKLFRLKTDDGQKFLAKVCQDNNKALMTNPNQALGKWLLRDKLNIKPGTVLDYEILNSLGFPYLKISKYDSENYIIKILKND